MVVRNAFHAASLLESFGISRSELVVDGGDAGATGNMAKKGKVFARGGGRYLHHPIAPKLASKGIHDLLRRPRVVIEGRGRSQHGELGLSRRVRSLRLGLRYASNRSEHPVAHVGLKGAHC